MDNFCQFYNRLNGEPYNDGVPAPPSYEIPTIDFGSGGGGAELTPLRDEDMAISSREDMNKEMERQKRQGFNPTKLGEPMSDEDFQKFHGLK